MKPQRVEPRESGLVGGVCAFDVCVYNPKVMLGPTLAGQLVTLAPLKPEHLEHYVEWFADPEVTQYLTLDLVFTLKQEEEWLDRISRSNSDVPGASSWRGSTSAARVSPKLTGAADTPRRE